MTRKKKRRRKASESRSERAPTPPVKAVRGKKAVPPPDNPLLRNDAEREARGAGGDEADMARARARALELTKDVPVADPERERPGSDESS